MKLKICGMKYPENILEVAALRPIIWDLYFERSSRYFEDTNSAIKSIKNRRFVNESVANIIEKY
jgi:phosphoribosylanthranilate isomerase